MRLRAGAHRWRALPGVAAVWALTLALTLVGGVSVAQASDGLTLDPDLAVPADATGLRLRPPVSDWPVPGVSASARQPTEPGADWLSGMASIYSQRFHGRPTASGEPYLSHGWTAAHRDLPLGTLLSVRNPANNTEVVVRVNDRGPFHANRMVDLSMAAAQSLGLLRQGVAMVVIRPLSADQADRRALGPQPAGAQLVAADALSSPPDVRPATARQRPRRAVASQRVATPTRSTAAPKPRSQPKRVTRPPRH